MSRSARGAPERDQAESAFGVVLAQLCRHTGARAAALVDAEGETVDYAGELEPFEVRVAAAEWRIVLARLQESRVVAWRTTTELRVRAHRATYVVHALPEDYALVVVGPRFSFTVSPRALSEAAHGLVLEAGLSSPHRGLSEVWRRVRVQASGAQRRPTALWRASAWAPLELLGRCADAPLTPGERGYRARLADGVEFTLVRERLGHWYSDCLIPNC